MFIETIVSEPEAVLIVTIADNETLANLQPKSLSRQCAGTCRLALILQQNANVKKKPCQDLGPFSLEAEGSLFHRLLLRLSALAFVEQLRLELRVLSSARAKEKTMEVDAGANPEE